MAYLIAVVVGLGFGAFDQFLGTIRFGAWAWAVSGMSAPWLVLPFLVGMTQERPRRAMALGLVATLAALVGYFAMTYSPMEGVPIDHFFSGFATIARTDYNPVWIVGGLTVGPLFGLLGQRWRVARAWTSTALVTAALCLEPFALRFVGMLAPHPLVWVGEVAIGGLFAVSLAFEAILRRRARAAAAVPPTR